MNSVHDLGGMHGFGPVCPQAEDETSPFHAEWERRIFAIYLALGTFGKWSIDEARFSREVLDPALYLGSSYFQRWLAGLDILMLRHGMVSAEELERGVKHVNAQGFAEPLRPEHVASVFARGSSSARTATKPARFQLGQAVTTLQMNSETHTRLPRYCRGRPGTIHLVHGMHVYPDTQAIRAGEHPEWLYTVRFDAKYIWGADTTADDILVDCWEPYLREG